MQNDNVPTVEIVPQNAPSLPTRLVYLEPVADPAPRAHSRGLPELLELIRTRKLTLLGVVCLALVGAAAFTFTQRPSYVAGTTVELQGPNEGIGVLDTGAD